MRRTTRRTPWIAAALVAAAFWPATSLAATDAWITAKTKMTLLTSSDVSATDVNVDTVDGRVTLHGKVGTERAKERAGELARGIEGTRDVRNLLQVVPPTRDDRTAAKDADLEKRVEKSLEGAPQLAGSDIEVASVNDGVVLLSGTADSFDDHLAAVGIAAAVPGVQRVASEVKSPDAIADDEIRREGDRAAAQPAAHAARGVAAAASDAWITSETKLRLLADANAPAFDVNVDTSNGVVTLFGTVTSPAQKSAAEADARKVDGVKTVCNELQVVAAAKQDAVAAKDADIEKAVESALAKRGSLDDVDVEVKNGVVRLTGRVPSDADRVTAAVAARSTPGVRSVLADDLAVAGEG